MLDLNLLLDEPAAALLSAAGNELVLFTLQHEHANKGTIERRRLGSSIDLAELLRVIGNHGLEAPAIQVSKVAALQLPAPDEPAARPDEKVCPECGKVFATQQALGSHRYKSHGVSGISETAVALRAARVSDPPAVAPASVEPTGLICSECGKSCKNQHGLQTHMAMKHAIESKIEGVACAHCGGTFLSKGLSVHIARMHKDKAVAPTKPAIDGICSVCNTAVALHERCSDCAVLLGSAHEAGRVAGNQHGLPLCAMCVDYRRVEHKLDIGSALEVSHA